MANFRMECTALEPNESFANAFGPLAVDVAYVAYLCPYDSVDWYWLETGSASSIRVALSVPPLADLHLYLHDGSGAQIGASATIGDGDDEEIVSAVLPAGRYYVRVLPFSRRDPYQPYSLTISLL